jgi:hypothetical protein
MISRFCWADRPVGHPYNGHTIWMKIFKLQYPALTQVIHAFQFTAFWLTDILGSKLFLSS